MESGSIRDEGNIPSEEEFARASKYMDEGFLHLEQVREAVLLRFRDTCPLYAFHIMPQRGVDFRAYIFFNTEKDIETCKNSGIAQQIIDFVYSELERVGRGTKAAIKVAFEFDSNENVISKYNGDYFLRLQ